MRSSDWCTKEKEWSDSDGNLARSSQVPTVGDVGVKESEFTLVPGVDHKIAEAVTGLDIEGRACCQIRRRPEK